LISESSLTQTYNFNKKRNSVKIEEKFNKEELNILIESFFIVKEDTKEHVKYNITCTYDKKKWKIQKRFSEFDSLNEMVYFFIKNVRLLKNIIKNMNFQKNYCLVIQKNKI
jgi:hypothetical protein